MPDFRHAFPDQKPDENVLAFLRRDILNFLPTALLIVFLLGFGIVMLLVAAVPGIAIFDGIFRHIAALLVTTYLLMVGLFAAVAWLDFYFDVHILTNIRLVDIDQNKLFSRDVEELALEQVEDVTAHETGILETFANFGDVNVQTAGEQQNSVIDKVPFPRELAALIIDLSEQAKRNIEASERAPSGVVRGIIEGRLIDSDDEMRHLGAII